MKPASSEGAMRIQATLGDSFRILEFEQSTHSSAEAAAAIGCDVAQIAKSMMFQAADGRPVLGVTAGANRGGIRRLGEVEWCERGDSNPHARRAVDFESTASTVPPLSRPAPSYRIGS